MLGYEQFRHCPRCGQPLSRLTNPLSCAGCGLTYFFNPTVAAAAFVFDLRGRVILIRRDRDPAKGQWTIPGGFVDMNETAEEGLRREVREEVGLEIEHISFLCSEPNRYLFKEVTYPVCDLVFTAQAIDAQQAKALDGAAQFEWRLPKEIEADHLAFPSVIKGLKLLVSHETISR